MTSIALLIYALVAANSKSGENGSDDEETAGSRPGKSSSMHLVTAEEAQALLGNSERVTISDEVRRSVPQAPKAPASPIFS